MKQTRLRQMECQILKVLDSPQGEKVVYNMEQEYQYLCDTLANPPKSLLRHLHNNIFPVVATFRSLLQAGFDHEKAAKLTEDNFLELMKPSARSIQRLCKLPGFYKLVPRLFGKLMPLLFKADAGFVFKNKCLNKYQVAFDISSCPYYDVCQKLECPELAPIFCSTDDLCYGNMHPKLKWNRSQTIAQGGNFCDFNIKISTKNNDTL